MTLETQEYMARLIAIIESLVRNVRRDDVEDMARCAESVRFLCGMIYRKEGDKL